MRLEVFRNIVQIKDGGPGLIRDDLPTHCGREHPRLAASSERTGETEEVASRLTAEGD